jgi:hypothetical protein
MTTSMQSKLIAAFRAIAYEPNPRYPPEEFLPERFLDPEVPTADPASYVFGFGRR